MVAALAATQAGVSTLADWRRLQSSDHIVIAVDANSIRRVRDEAVAKLLTATRDFNMAKRQFSSSYVIASVRVDCRTHLGRMSLGAVYASNGRVVEPADPGEDADGPVDRAMILLLCSEDHGRSVDRKGSPTIAEFLHRMWPPVPGVGRGW